MKTTEIDGVKLRLTQPDELKLNWIGSHESLTQLLAAWTILAEEDIPLNPRILGQPGVGKTTLAYSGAQKISPDKVYIFQCTMDTRPEDLIIQPVINEDNKIEYHASGLVSAMLDGGICILDEGNRMSEKSWASLAPLLDKRRYVESIIAGIKIRAHPDFRIAVTMNTDSSTYEIPEYIDSRLQPKIFLDYPSAKDEFAILKYNIPFADDFLIQYLVSFLQNAHRADRDYSVRDGINIARYYLKLTDKAKLVYGEKDKEDRDVPDSHMKTDSDDNSTEDLDDESIFDFEKPVGFFALKEFELAVEQILDIDAVDFLRAIMSKRFRKILKDNSKLKDSLDSRDFLKKGFLSDLWDEDTEESDFEGDFLHDDIDYEDEDDEDEDYFDVAGKDENDGFYDDLGHLFGPLNDNAKKRRNSKDDQDWDDDEGVFDFKGNNSEDAEEEFLKFVDESDTEKSKSIERKNLEYINKLKSRVKKNLKDIESKDQKKSNKKKQEGRNWKSREDSSKKRDTKRTKKDDREE